MTIIDENDKKPSASLSIYDPQDALNIHDHKLMITGEIKQFVPTVDKWLSTPTQYPKVFVNEPHTVSSDPNEDKVYAIDLGYDTRLVCNYAYLTALIHAISNRGNYKDFEDKCRKDALALYNKKLEEKGEL
jgi:hypothetical protein